MSFGEGHNVFNDIPGFDASKGERIVKALRRLWAKIERLEQIRNSERTLQSKEVQTSSNDGDWTSTDVQYKLLVLQLKYIRSLIKKNQDTLIAASHDVVDARSRNIQGRNYYNWNVDEVHYPRNPESEVVCEGTQTGNSLIEGFDPFISSESDRNQGRADAQVGSDFQAFRFGDSIEHATSTSQKTLPTSSKSHYHLKLDDVPFILGASSTASHSVVANVQNIIAMMKMHNRALCGPRHHVHRVAPSINTHSTKRDTQEASKMLNNLSTELHELGLKQAALVKRFDAAEGKNQLSNTSKVNKISSVNKIGLNMPRRVRSISESTKLKADITNTSKTRRVLSKVNYQPNTLPIVARHKFLRSLQNFKTHLSEDDISWE